MANTPTQVDIGQGRWVLVATILASSMAFIDSSALNVVLPAIQDDLGARANDLLWIVNGYHLMLAALIMVGGALGDHYGRKRVFSAGIGIFAVASLLCGLAPTSPILIVARIVQGVGGALMIPGSLAIIAALFDGTQRGVAIGTWSSITTLTTILGPVLGGELAQLGLWRGVFFINLPLAAVAMWILLTKIPETYDDEVAGQPLDWWGALLITLALGGMTYGFIEAPAQGWTAPIILITLGGGMACLGIFAWWQKRNPHPMVPLHLFKSRTFSGTNLMTLFLYGALSGALFFLPLNMVQIQGYEQNEAGRAMLPFALMLTVLSRRAGRMADKFGARRLLTIGPALTGFGFLWLAIPGVTDGAGDYWLTFFPAILCLGVGMGITVAPLTSSVMGAVPQNRAGVASGVNNAVARTAGVLAVAILGAVALVSFRAELTSRAEALALSAPLTDALLAQTEDLGAAEAPTDTPSAQVAHVEAAIAWGFVDTFRLVNIIAGLMALVSAGLAWRWVEVVPPA